MQLSSQNTVMNSDIQVVLLKKHYFFMNVLRIQATTYAGMAVDSMQ